ncbi:endoplasmic reticulum metallopeptidase 1-like [Arctopsyche grandis]|uniref:endoplasmic reticulum metallopeptidase 1-like n=1 Tax=Arctopsyche grandis TaxID=121162 RepID=UPI00406D6A55
MEDASQLRQRGIYQTNYSASSDVPTKVKASKKGEQPITFLQLTGIFIFIICTMVAVVVIEKKLPIDLKITDEPRNPGRFIAQRAMDHLIELTSFGPRVSGSHENEVLAVNFLKQEINKIINEAKDIHIIQMNIQKTSGAFPLTFLDGLTSVYRNLQNVIVRIGSRINSEHSLLLNCHYDSVADSPGASDDGAGCAVMLEILRVMSKSDRLLKHNVIFLFNGAEENVLQASHGFITQHKWAKEVRAFINLEACGAGGREVLFQAGPNNPWIMEVYSQTVPYPYASSLAQEIFDSGLIPGETDFRIFRDFGKVSGLDFAWSTNGYVYHTKFDQVNQIPLGTLQRTGDNILALTIGISNGNYLSQGTSMEGQPVFFDLLGAFVVRFPISVAGVAGLIVLSLSIANIYLNIVSAKKRAYIDPRTYMNCLQKACFFMAASWVITVVSCCGLAMLLTSLGRAMSWYARPFWLYTLYVLQVVSIPAICLLIVTTKQRLNPNFSGWLLVQLYADAFSLLWSSLLLLCLLMRIRSGFLAMLWVLCPAAVGLLRHSLVPHWNDWKRLLLYLIGMVLPFVQSYYLVLGAVYMFIPIMGRTGASIYPELIVGVLISLMFILVLGWIGPLILGAESPWKLVKWTLGVTLVSVALVILTPLGFPYSGNPSRPAPQRFMILHTDRQFLGLNGTLNHQSSGFWMVDLDPNSPHSVDGYVPSMRYSMEINYEDCNTQLYCGVPYLLPVQGLISRTSWLEGAPPSLPYRAHLNLTDIETVNSTLKRFHFKISGPDHMGLMISPMAKTTLKSWSFLAGQKPLAGPRWDNNTRDTYFIYLAAASEHETPWHFHVDIVHSFKEEPHHWLDISLVGHFLHGPHKSDPVLTSFVNNFPIWTAVTSWSSTFTHYIF